MRKSLLTFALSLFLYLAQYATAQAGTCTIVPSGAGSQELDSGTYTQVDLATCAGGSLTGLNIQSSATLTANGSITVSGDVTVSGTLTHAAEDVNGLNLTASNINIPVGGRVDVSGKGCRGADGGDGAWAMGPDLNNGNVCTYEASGAGGYQYGGGNYGGLGGQTIITYTPYTYGSQTAPIFLGSGGGGGSSPGNGYGGGLAQLFISGTAIVDGILTANGQNGGGGQSGGSGGSIYLKAGILSGSGSITSTGGNGDGYGGGGGGGRIAIYYGTLDTFDLSDVSANAGNGGWIAGYKGTTYILDRTVDDGSGTLTIPSGLEFTSNGDFTRTAFNILNGAYLRCEAQTTLTISTTGNYTDQGSTWDCSSAISTLNLNVGATLNASDISWSITNTDALNLTAVTFTNSGTNTFTFNKAGAQANWNISNNLTLNNFTYTGGASGTTSYQGGVLFIDDAISISLVNSDINSSVSWTNLTGLSIDANSSINATGTGCSASISTLDGYGPNLLDVNYACAQGDVSGVEGAGRGQYGGAGHCSAGLGSYGPPSTTYDSATAPVLPGSGGGGGASGGHGGGIIRLAVANTLTLNGNLYANGTAGGAQGGGSGGSIWITASTVTGSGSVYSNGVTGNFYGAPGGAGYIALYYDVLDSFNISQLHSDGVSGSTENCTPYTSLNPGLVLSPNSLSISESGEDTFTVALSTEPSADVTVSVVSSDTSIGTVSPANLTFTSGNYSTPQTVTVSGVDNQSISGTTNFDVNLSASSADNAYNGKTGSVAVTVSDDDTAGVTLTPSSLTLNEASGSDHFTVNLNTQPTDGVDVTLSYDSSKVSVTPTLLSFTTINWASAQTVTVTALNNDVQQSSSTNITFALTSNDSNYNGLSVSPETITITDDDEAGVNFSTQILNLTEGSTGSYTLVLNSQPTHDVTITPSTTSADIDFTPKTLVFTSSNWSAPQSVSVEALSDQEYEGAEEATITHSISSADPNYSNLSVGNVTVNISEESFPEIEIPNPISDPQASSITNNTLSYSVTLSTPSPQPVSVQYATQNGTAIAGKDYVEKSGSLTWAPGESGSKAVNIELLGSYTLVSENDFLDFSIPFISTAYADTSSKTIILNFSNADNANLSNSSVTLTIQSAENAAGGGCSLQNEAHFSFSTFVFVIALLFFRLKKKRLMKAE